MQNNSLGKVLRELKSRLRQVVLVRLLKESTSCIKTLTPVTFQTLTFANNSKKTLHSNSTQTSTKYLLTPTELTSDYSKV